MLGSAICFCLTLGLVGLSHWIIVSMILAVVTGFTMITFAATANTTLQTLSPDHLRGRIMSVYMLVFNGTTPIGNLLIGWLAGLVGITFTLLAAAAISLVAAITGWIKRDVAEKDLQQVLKSDL